MNEQVIEEALKDPMCNAYCAGFDRAKEIYTSPNPGQLAYITNGLDHFLVWRKLEPPNWYPDET